MRINYDLESYAASLTIPTEEGPVAPTYKPPTESFRSELDMPTIVTAGSKDYGAYVFNRQQVGEQPPVLVTFPALTTPRSIYGATMLNGLVTHMERPIVAVDMPGDEGGLSYVPTQEEGYQLRVETEAEVRLSILDKLKMGESIDFMGICMGGAIAAKAAILAGGRARRLLTYATPGFENDIAGRYPPSPAEKELSKEYFRDAVLQDHFSYRYFRGTLPWTKIDEDGPAENRFLVLGLSAGLSKLNNLPEQLDASTKWQDVIGTRDNLSDWENHVQTVAARNNLSPGSSVVKVVEGGGHEYSRLRIVLTARDAELALAS